MKFNEHDITIYRNELIKLKTQLHDQVAGHLNNGIGEQILTLLRQHKTPETHEPLDNPQHETDHLATLIEMTRQIFIVNKIDDSALKTIKNHVVNLPYYIQELRLYDDIPRGVNQNPTALRGLSDAQRAKIKNISVVYVSGSRFNPFGHAALFLGKDVGYAHIRPAKKFPYTVAHPQLMSVDEFNNYLKNNNKRLIAVQQVKLSDANLPAAIEKLHQLLQKKWVWWGFRRNCLSFCKDVLRAGGYHCQDLGDKMKIKQQCNQCHSPKKGGSRPLPLRRLQDVNPAQLNQPLTAGLKPAGLDHLKQAANTLAEFEKSTNDPSTNYRPNMREVYDSVKIYIEPKDRVKWQWRINWAFVWNIYSYVFNSPLVPQDVLIRSKIALLKKLRDFEFNVLENNFIHDQTFNDVDLKQKFDQLKQFGYTSAQVKAVLQLMQYIKKREKSWLNAVGKNNIRIAKECIQRILANSKNSVSAALEFLSIDEVKQSQGILARHRQQGSDLVKLLMELKQDTTPGADISIPLWVV